jgi:hypothetical protein
MAASVIVASENAAGYGIPGARPEALLAGIEVTIVLVQSAGETVGHSALNGILSCDIGKSLAVARGSLFPFLWFIFPLVNSGRERRLHVAL